MPRRDDIESILIIGSGPIVIGQACEFDYSGTQACRVLKEEGYRVILANSNPATIMTDPDFADATYIEPLTWEVLSAIIDREQPDAVLPTLGGQTGLNIAMELFERGLIGVPGKPEMIGANAEAIATAEDRENFKVAMTEIGLESCRSLSVRRAAGESLDDAVVRSRTAAEEIGLPIMIRPAYILGGRGTGIASTMEQFEQMAASGIEASPIGEILIEESILGWKEYELEVMRDRADNCVIICGIENFDPMGVHTGDSITVAPIQTLTDVEYQQMRDAAIACIRRVGVETGGSNVQFAVNPVDGRQVVIEMNPRVSRSSALASKATGFPIAKIAAKLAVGYTLDEIPNDITTPDAAVEATGVADVLNRGLTPDGTGQTRYATPAAFEPVIDYVVTKIPRWAFEKLPGASGILGTQMQAVGEVMAIGRTFPESLQKAIRSLELGYSGLGCDPAEDRLITEFPDDESLLAQAAIPTPDRVLHVGEALRRGISIEVVNERTGIDPWFLDQMSIITEERLHLADVGFDAMTARDWKRAKRLGFSDVQLGHQFGRTEDEVRSTREAAGVIPTYKTVDTCAAEFDAETPYHYSTYEDENEVRSSDAQKVVILGSGPNRIGQGIEFDYCCVHASFALRDAGFETIMINCNPETVSTDYDTSDRLYFEPLTREDVLNVIAAEQPYKVIVSLGGQTPLKLAGEIPLELVAGTSPDSIDAAEDRKRWNKICDELQIPQPPGGTAIDIDEALAITDEIGFPVLVRPSYVLGGRAMQIVHDRDHLTSAMEELAGFGSLGKEGGLSAERPVLIDRFLADATEVDVDAIRDRTGEVLIGGVMEHVEEAGVHSGDSACAIPPQTLPSWVVAVIEAYASSIAKRLDVQGLINVQFAVAGTTVYVIEANPRASRTVPFVAKATGVPLAKVATRVMLGATLEELRDEGLLRPPVGGGHHGPGGGPAGPPPYVAVKEAVLPFNRFPQVDPALGPEMRSTGEVMGIADTFGKAFYKAELAAGTILPESGTVFLSLADPDKPAGLVVAQRMQALGLGIVATVGTAEYLKRFDVHVDRVLDKVQDHAGTTAVDLIAAGEISFVVNTPRGRIGRTDGAHIRKAASLHGVACVTTVDAALAAAQGLAEREGVLRDVKSLQEYHLIETRRESTR